MNKPHKRAEVIKAWADGAEIEYRFRTVKGQWTEWFPISHTPVWNQHESFEYRVKVDKKKELLKKVLEYGAKRAQLLLAADGWTFNDSMHYKEEVNRLLKEIVEAVEQAKFD